MRPHRERPPGGVGEGGPVVVPLVAGEGPAQGPALQPQRVPDRQLPRPGLDQHPQPPPRRRGPRAWGPRDHHQHHLQHHRHDDDTEDDE